MLSRGPQWQDWGSPGAALEPSEGLVMEAAPPGQGEGLVSPVTPSHPSAMDRMG